MFRALIVLLLILLAGLQYRLWFGEANILEVRQLRADIERQVEENDRLILRNHQLEAEVRDLRNGLSAIEERARSGQGMIKQGETFYQLIEPRNAPQE